MIKLLQFTFLFGFLFVFSSQSYGQCSNPTINLPDANSPVNGNPASAFCTTVTFDPAITGVPTGLSMQLQHTFQGDLSIFIVACNNTLMVMNRPGVVASCAGSCPCGNSGDIGSPGNPVLVTFSDNGGPDPENGIAQSGGNYGVTTDNSCNASTVSSFAQLWAGCPPGEITAQICIADHAFADVGIAANVTLIYPTPVVCGCTDPNAPNYNPLATVDDGSCLQNCATLILTSAPQSPVSCPGGTVAIGTTISGQTGPVTYTWTGPDIGFLSNPNVPNPIVTIPPNFSGSLTFTLIAVSGTCASNTTITIDVVPPPPPVINGPTGICPGQGGVSLTVEGNHSAISWNVGSSAPSITVTQPGEYSVTVTDASGCPSSNTYVVSPLPIPTPEIIGPTAICSNGSAVLDVGGGYSSYSWSTGSADPTTTITEPGAYLVTVINEDGCSATADIIISLLPDPEPPIYWEGQLCSSGGSVILSTDFNFTAFQWSNGSLDPTTTVTEPGTYFLTATDDLGCTGIGFFTVTAVTPPTPVIEGFLSICPDQQTTLTVTPFYSAYQWSSGESNQSIQVYDPGTYSVTATSAEGCEVYASVNVIPVAVTPPVIVGNTQLCYGSSTILDAGPNYLSYQWSDGSISRAVSISEQGAYAVTVTDENGCDSYDDIDIEVFPEVVTQINGDSILCEGQDDVTLMASPGFNSYAWSSNANTPNITISASGTYTVTVTNSIGCTGTASFVVNATELDPFDIAGPTVFCVEGSTTLSVPNIFSGYQWSTGSSDTTTLVMSAGTYTVTVSDADGCIATKSITVQNHPVPTPEITGVLQICPGSSTSLTADSLYMSYAWNTGANSQQISVNAPGAYLLSVTDSNGCIGTDSVSVVLVPELQPTIAGVLSYCAGSSTSLSANAGYASYSWSNNAALPQITVNSPGNYAVTVADANGCTGQTSVQVVENPLPVVNISGSSTFCIGSFTTLSVDNPGSTFQWSNGTSSASIQIASPGQVSVTVTDANGCISNASLQVTQESELMPQISGPLNFCPGSQTTLNAGSGFATYQWSNNGSGQAITVNQPGTYTVSVTDASGCSGTGTVLVGVFPQPQALLQGVPSFCQGTTTSLSTSLPFATYQWNNGANQRQITISSPGTYTVTVTDFNGCIDSVTTMVEEFPTPVFDISGQDYFCAGSATTLTTPTGYNTYIWSNGQQTPAISVNTGGTYRVTITSINGCSASRELAVTRVSLPIADAGGLRELTCNSPSVMLGGNGTSLGNAYTYQWTGPGIHSATAGTPQPVVQVAGVYTLVVTDTVYGCISSLAQTTVSDLTALPAVSLNVQGSLNCTATTVVLSGTGSATGTNISYQWLGPDQNPIQGANQPNYTTSSPGQYTLRVINTYTGCINQLSGTVNQDATLPVAEAGAPQLLNCLVLNATLDGAQSSSGSNIAYLWSTPNGNIVSGATMPTASVNQPGLYVLRVTNLNNNCVSRDTVIVSQDITPPTVQLSPGGEIDCLHPSIQLSGAGSSSGDRFRYEWLRAGSPAILSNALQYVAATAGNYQLRVVNTANGCAAVASVLVTENPEQPRDLEIVSENPTCFGDTDGNIFIGTVTGGTPPFLFSFNGGPFRQQVLYPDLGGGVYSVVVQDAIGCELSLNVNLHPGNDLELDLGPDQTIRIGQRAQLEAAYNIPDEEVASFLWTTTDTIECDTCTSINVGPFITRVYTATLIDVNGCALNEDVTVFVRNPREVYIPNGFSPNNDGQNDRLWIYSDDDVEYVRSFLIFNRWGEAVFEVYNFPANDPAYGWDGYHRGVLYNAAVFTYLAEVQFIDGSVKLFKGDVTLMR
jgi:gliding motility-associated-like protein